MYKLLIYHDDGTITVAVQGTQEQIIKAMPGVAAQLDPDSAVWELVWENGGYDINQAMRLLGAQMGATNGH